MSHFTQALEHARGPGDLFFWFSSQVMGWCKTWMPLYHSAVIDMPTLSQRWVYDLCAEAILIGSIWGNKGRPGVPSELPQWGNTWWVRTLQALPFLELHLTRSKTHSFGLWVWYMTAAGVGIKGVFPLGKSRDPEDSRCYFGFWVSADWLQVFYNEHFGDFSDFGDQKRPCDHVGNRTQGQVRRVQVWTSQTERV